MTDFAALKYEDHISLKNRLFRFLWNLVCVLLFRPTPRGAFLNGFRIFLLRAFGAQIGKGCRVSPSARIWAPWNLRMGEFTALGDDVDCYNMALITLGSKVAVSQRAYLCTGTHDISSLRRPLVVREIVIESHAWICAEAFVGPGVVVREGAVVAARACIVREVPPWSVMAGNPAKVVKQRSVEDRKR